MLLLINVTATIAMTRDNGSVLNNCCLSAFVSNCDNLREAHIFNICSSDVFKRSRPSAVMDPEHDPEWTQSRMDTISNRHNPEWTQSRMGTIPNGHNPEWTRSQMARSRMNTNIYLVTLVFYSYCLV